MGRLLARVGLAVVVLAAGLGFVASSGAVAQAVANVEVRDRLIADQEALLNVYRCMFNVDTQVVPGGCSNGAPTLPAKDPAPFSGTPTAQDVAVRDHLIANQESLLNVYRCQFSIDVELVPSGCRDTVTECDEERSCPDEPVDRSPLAVWLVEVLEGESVPDFVDANGSPVDFSEILKDPALLALLTPCSTEPARLCPIGNITRRQMAVLLARGLELSDSRSAKFVDVNENDAHYESINKVDFAKIDVGCGGSPRQFCPNEILSRREAANALEKATAWIEAVKVVGITGLDDSISLEATYDEDDLEADLSWRAPTNKAGEVDHYVVQWRMPWEGFTPLWHQVVDIPENSRETIFELSISNAKDVRNLYAIRVITVYSNGDRLATNEVRVSSYTHQFRDLIKERLVDAYGEDQRWLTDVWGHIDSYNCALVATKGVGTKVYLGGYDNPDSLKITTAKVFDFNGSRVPYFDDNLNTIVHELGHVYTLTDGISEDTAPVGIGRLYLSLLRLELRDNANNPSYCRVDELYADLAEMVFFHLSDKFQPGYGVRGGNMGYWNSCGFRLSPSKYQDVLVEVPQIAQAAFVDQEIPDWFYDTYQQANGDIDLEKLWIDIDSTYTQSKAIIAHSLRNEFGGYCSEADVRSFIRGEVTGITNPWNDGGCNDTINPVKNVSSQGSSSSGQRGSDGSIPYDGPIGTYHLRFLQRYRSSPDRCWIAIDGYAYDVTPSVGYVYTGPGSIEQLCGQDASEHFSTNNLDPPPQEFIRGYVRN